MDSKQIKEGGVYAPHMGGARDSHRRVVSIYGETVCWCNGGERPHYCSLESFRRWVGRTGARDVSNVTPRP